MTLWELNPSSHATISKLSKNLHKQLYSRLNDLGFIPTETITCLRASPFNGPRVFQVSDSVFALDREIAQLIQVEPK